MLACIVKFKLEPFFGNNCVADLLIPFELNPL